ncbi:foldase protein PrsA precursor [bacterium BMS3Bbin04]|nr:foldase protein PrsA precursor [bacterium BMS3Bbin04]
MMMSSLRKNTAVILWVLVFAFIGTIIFSWGMGGFTGPMKPGVVGKIDGEDITRDQYEQQVQDRFAMERQRYPDGEIPQTRAEQLRQEAWDALINERLLQRAEQKAGITISDAEVAMTVRHSPPPQIMNNPNLQDSTGAFDWALYQSVISDPSNIDFVLNLESVTRVQMIRQKMMGRLGAVIHVSEEDLKREYVRANQTAVASYIVVDNRHTDVDSSVVTEDELRQAYRDRMDEFKVNGAILSQYVLIKKEPTREDTVAAMRLAENLKHRCEEGESFADLAAAYSDDGSAENGGDLGWFGRDRMVEAFEKAAFKAEVGEIVGPIPTQFGFHIIKKMDERETENGPEVLASHILINIQLSPQSEEENRNRAMSFHDEAEESGFEAAAELYNMDIDTMEIQNNGIIPGLGRNMSATNYMFERPIGDITPTYEFRSSWVVLRMIEERPDSVTSFEEVKNRLLPDLLKPYQYELGRVEMERLHSRLLELDGTLETLAEAEGIQVRDTRRPFKANEFISTVGRDHIFAYVAFNLEVGQISEPFKGEKGYYMIRLDSLSTPPMDEFDANRDALYSEIAQKIQQDLFTQWIDIERETLDVKDYRYLYFSSY